MVVLNDFLIIKYFLRTQLFYVGTQVLHTQLMSNH